MLHFKTFGGLSVEIDGIPATGAAQQRKTLALLALLAASGHRGLSRDKLIALLWPETDAEHGRGLLKQACYSLRRDLQTRDLFLGSIQLRLNPAVISSDVESFASALEQNDPGKAVSFYTAPFLDGFYLNEGGEFESWAETERARLASQYRAALELLSAEATKRGEHRAAAEWWRRLLELDPLSSHSALGLITALDSAGEHAEALRRGQAYGELVRSELGTDPPPELSAWIEQHRHAAVSGARPSNQPPAASPAPAPNATAPRRSLVAVRRWGAAVGLAGLAAAGILLLGSRTNLPTDPNLLAVAPFDVLDPSLALWHEGLVDILSRDLDGAGPVRTVPQTVGVKRWRGRADRVSAESFGHRTGAGLVVFGSVRKARDTVSLRATVLDLGRKRVGPDLEVKGDTSDIGDLADSLGVAILRVLGRDRPIGSVRRVSIGSRSLPALKAFLSGEQFYRRGRWDSALVYYDQAIAQDSTFTIAYKQMGMTVDWHPTNEQSYLVGGIEYFRKAVLLNHGLSPKDSMQIAADSFYIASVDATNPADLIRFTYRWFSTLEEAARRYPEDPEVWYRLGDARFHDTPPLGGVPAQALEAFDHAIAVDSGFAPAYEHTVELAILLNRPDLARQYAAAYLRLDPTDANAPTTRLIALLLDPERSQTLEAARAIDSSSTWVLVDGGQSQLGWWPDSGESAVRLLRELTTRSGNGAYSWTDTLMYHQFLARALTFRGHLHEAYATDRRLLVNAKASRFTWFLDPFLVLALLGAVPESVTARTFGQALEPGIAWPMSYSRTPRQMRGLPWWLARGDTVSLARFALRAEQETATQANATGKLRGRYLHAAATAYLALARGDSVRALHLFQSIPDTLCIVNVCYYEKLIEARLLAAEGQARQAGAVLDQWVWSAEGPFFVLGKLERARIAETLGERQKAIDSYRFVVDAWRRADPELQPFVIEARNALARLRRE